MATVTRSETATNRFEHANKFEHERTAKSTGQSLKFIGNSMGDPLGFIGFNPLNKTEVERMIQLYEVSVLQYQTRFDRARMVMVFSLLVTVNYAESKSLLITLPIIMLAASIKYRIDSHLALNDTKELLAAIKKCNDVAFQRFIRNEGIESTTGRDLSEIYMVFKAPLPSLESASPIHREDEKTA